VISVPSIATGNATRFVGGRLVPGQLKKWQTVQPSHVIVKVLATPLYVSNITILQGMSDIFACKVYGSGYDKDGKGMIVVINGTGAVLFASRSLVKRAARFVSSKP
jgi:Rieske Fe-S protein